MWPLRVFPGRFVGLSCAIVVSACSQQVPREGQSQAQPVVEVAPEATAFADVDKRATLALKQDLVTRFPQNSDPLVVEAGLQKIGYECGPNPAAPAERACLKVVKRDQCEDNAIVRVKPYVPERAQFIRICALAKPK
jgi:hypothetical protein